MVLEDASMRLELRHVPNDHSDGMLIAFMAMHAAAVPQTKADLMAAIGQ